MPAAAACVCVRVRKTLPTWGRELKLFNKWHDCNVCECAWRVACEARVCVCACIIRMQFLLF